MKKLVFLIFLLIINVLCKAQTVISSIDLNSAIAEMDTMKVMYIHVAIGDNKKNFLAFIDAGDGKDWTICNKESKKMKGFKSPAEVFNFLHNNQWEYVDAIANVSSTGAFGQIVFGVNKTKTELLYIFKRRKE